MSTDDPVGTALASILAGAATGAAAMTAGVLLLRISQYGQTDDLSRGTGFMIVGTSLFVGIVLAVASGWLRSKPIDDPYRRGVIGAVSVFGAFLLALLATAADMVAGAGGIALYLTLLVAALVIGHRSAARAGAARTRGVSVDGERA